MPMIRDGVSGDWIGTFQGHKGAVWSCKVDPSGNLAATASGDFSVKLWDAITGRPLHTYKHEHIVKTVDFSPDSTQLATGGQEGILRIYSLLILDGAPVCIPQPYPISKILWLNRTRVAVAASDGVIRVWEGTKHICNLSVEGDVRDMELRDSILTVAAGNKVFFFDMYSLRLVHAHSMPIHFNEEGGASLYGSKFIAGGSALWIYVFDYESGKQLDCLKGHHGPIRCLRYSPDGTTFASGSEDGTIRIWKTN